MAWGMLPGGATQNLSWYSVVNTFHKK